MNKHPYPLNITSLTISISTTLLRLTIGSAVSHPLKNIFVIFILKVKKEISKKDGLPLKDKLYNCMAKHFPKEYLVWDSPMTEFMYTIKRDPIYCMVTKLLSSLIIKLIIIYTTAIKQEDPKAIFCELYEKHVGDSQLSSTHRLYTYMYGWEIYWIRCSYNTDYLLPNDKDNWI